MSGLPYEAEIQLAKEKKFEETIIFVHHFGGDKRTVLRHVRLVNELGFDCVRFNLKFNMNPNNISAFGDFKIGLRSVWAGQIQDILNAITGKKILYSFSMPSAAAVQAMSQRNAFEISGLICDGGPFLKIISRTWALYEKAYKVENKLLRAALTILSLGMWGPNFKGEMRKYFSNLPKDFPILSIRAGQDKLVPPAAIAELFALAVESKVEVFQIPNADHLEGLKNFAKEYSSQVESFLNKISHKIINS
jgi:pimeloyl-ACP methyl ester carboxylesterase